MWLPPTVSRELLDERRAREAEAAKALVTDAQYKWKKEFDADLQRIDPYLQLVWCPDPAPLEAIAAGAQPGFWHVARQDPAAPITLIPLQDEMGRPAEPGSWVFKMLENMDWWDDRVMRDREKRIRKFDEARKKREDREREERQEEIRERIQAIRETRVSMADVVGGWSQNVAGRRRGGQRGS